MTVRYELPPYNDPKVKIPRLFHIMSRHYVIPSISLSKYVCDEEPPASDFKLVCNITRPPPPPEEPPSPAQSEGVVPPTPPNPPPPEDDFPNIPPYNVLRSYFMSKRNYAHRLCQFRIEDRETTTPDRVKELFWITGWKNP